MSWTSSWNCSPSGGCDKCLDVTFDSESDKACLNQKRPGNDCIYEGSFLNGQNRRVFVSSEQCLVDGSMNKIQVHNRYHLRFFDCLAHPNPSATFATDQK